MLYVISSFQKSMRMPEKNSLGQKYSQTLNRMQIVAKNLKPKKCKSVVSFPSLTIFSSVCISIANINKWDCVTVNLSVSEFWICQ